jgi:hypothetical protein
MMVMTNLTFYAGYVAISVGITVWVGETLRRSGRKFLVRSLETEDLADTVNHLLQVGFYLANVGYIALVFRNYEPLPNAQAVLEVGLPKLGGVMLILGLVHLFNMLIVSRLARGRSQETAWRAETPRTALHRASEVREVLGGPYHLRG